MDKEKTGGLEIHGTDGIISKSVIPQLDGPVGTLERIDSVDVLRGVALLGILVINIDFFALPMMVLFNPSAAGGFTGMHLFAWKFNTLFFLQKMMGVFSMLFGAGLILMYERAEAANRAFGKIYYRRILILLGIGLIHAYFIWYGDILVPYALCGLLLYPLRRRSARLLIILGSAILIFGSLLHFGAGWNLSFLRSEATRAEEILQDGGTLTSRQEAMKNAWGQVSEMFGDSEESMAKETVAYRGGYGENLAFRVFQTVMMQTQAFFFSILWHVLGLMLLGMGLIKLGVFSGRRSMRFYILCIIIGYGAGLPLTGYGIGLLIERNFDLIYYFMIGGQFIHLASIPVALAHTGVVMIICKSGKLPALRRRLAAVGRTAFSNYLMHSIICTTVFYGYGFGLFNKIGRFWLVWFVVGLWILQLWLSPLWLRHFRYGPAEWLWRTLTYGRRQPMRLEVTQE